MSAPTLGVGNKTYTQSIGSKNQETTPVRQFMTITKAANSYTPTNTPLLEDPSICMLMLCKRGSDPPAPVQLFK